MTKSVVADFTTDVIPDTTDSDTPRTGRVLMNDSQVVIATRDTRRQISIDDIFDLAYGSAPQELRRFFETTVSLAYELEDGQRRVALIEGADDTVDQFTTLLFKAILNGADALVIHLARIGGRVTDNSPRPMTISIDTDAVRFVGPDEFEIGVSTVSGFGRNDREIRGSTRPVLSVEHAQDAQMYTTEIHLDSMRRMNVLGRFLKLEYSKLADELSDVELGDREAEALVGVYSVGDDASLASMLGLESNRVTMLLNSLIEKGLVEEGESGISLTPLGKLAVSKRIEQINS